MPKRRSVRASDRDLDAFTNSYVETALWSTNDKSNEQGGEPLDANYGPENIAEETMTLIEEDCADFQERYAELLADSGIDSKRAGHCFWLSREGHGSGFFDEDTVDREFRDRLQEAAESYGPFELIVGDDGQIWGPGAAWYREHHPRGGAAVREAWRGRRRGGHGEVPRWKQDEEEWLRRKEEYRAKTDPLKEGLVRVVGGDGLLRRGLAVPTGSEVVASLSDPRKSNEPVAHFRRYPGFGYGEDGGIGVTYFVDPAILPPEVREAPRGARGTRESRRHVARDFTTVPELVSHARAVDGATHVLVAGKRTRLYFPQRGGAHEEATVWHENGYWHGAAPSDRVVVDRLPPGAERIEDYLTRSGRWAAEAHGRTARAPSPDDPRRAAQAADDAWSAEGRRVFGRRWGDVRYTAAGRGKPGTELRRLSDAFDAATRAMRGEGALREPNTLSRRFPGRPR